MTESYRAARASAALFDRSSHGKIVLHGRDRAGLLQGLLTNDITALTPGTGCYALWLTPLGRIVADMRVLALEDRILMDVEPAATVALMAKLDQSIFTEDVQLTDESASLAEIGVHGPAAARIIATALGIGDGGWPAQVTALPEHASVIASLEQDRAIVVRSLALGVSGFDIFTDRARRDWLVDRLRQTGAAVMDAATAEVLRIEAGRPILGVDMDADTLPLEAGVEDRAISFTKGCYVGQEVVVRILHRGHGRVVRKLVGLTLPDGSGEPPASGARIFTPDGKDVGRVTSAAWSPLVGHAIALGYVHRDATIPGTPVLVNTRAAVVTQTPFVSARIGE